MSPADDRIPVYTSAAPPTSSPDELRARIPGWGVDLDLADRPSHPKEQFIPTGAHWDFPERQSEDRPRERSIEHQMLTPVFGTTAPLHGLSGVIRRFAYARFSEARAAHWLLLMAGDRVEVVESRVQSLAAGRPDNPIIETGVKAEAAHDGYAARRDSNRSDVRHQWLDPIIVGWPWLVAGGIGVIALRALRLRRRRS
ncbi:hypothetical protein GCM10011490_18980 [Pseudoclavibacter endophyticus]|uniref:Uncharacterized protein n=1 Tax=Pseudoclavibacter endophyticus TaxID=1778590 RepID=A0A6H9WIY5_9MICO|nr:hypothetical protein [Pseudoclavibacter endophyticus]KAB1648766.1 hypothetical protein F8O04_00185 [Pseudoclavibacter endophyticus]GGA68691.1 hypothetical protein GCM10011490_18980 [Pseudoclavibacter endophyticus]